MGVSRIKSYSAIYTDPKLMHFALAFAFANANAFCGLFSINKMKNEKKNKVEYKA